MQNAIPEEGIAKMLEGGKIEFDAFSVSMDDEARTLRGLHEALQKKIGTVSIQHLCAQRVSAIDLFVCSLCW